MQAILYNIRSSYNVGSIFRTADAVGIKKLFLCGYTPTPLDRFGEENRRLTKVSLGAEKTIAWEERKLSPLIIKLKKTGHSILALEQAANSSSIFDFQLSSSQAKRTVLLLGNELTGLPKSLLKIVDQIIEIPMHGKKESLNVSVAFGIAAYQIFRPVRS